MDPAKQVDTAKYVVVKLPKGTGKDRKDYMQRITIYIAIYRWPSISRVFRHIVVYLLYIEGKSGQYIDVVVLVKA